MSDKINIKTVTYNLKCDSAEGFSKRFAIAEERIKNEKPDIIGFQEALPHMQKIITEKLCGYTVIGYGRDSDFGGESNCVAFRSDLYTLFGFHQFWLSPTPYIPATRFEDQSSCPRVCVSLMLKHQKKADPFRFYNTHLDHVGENARVLGMNQVLKKINSDNNDWKLDFILTGDMNALPDSEAIKNALSNKEFKLHDVTSSLSHTFHNFGKIKNGCKIDYIFVSEGIEHAEPYLWDDCINSMTISDHYPVAADLIL